MADRFWKSMPAALKRPTLDKLYKRLRDLDYTQVDEKLTVMLNAILQLEAQGERRESATEAVFMVGYTTEGIYNQEQTRWLSWNVDGGVKGPGKETTLQNMVRENSHFLRDRRLDPQPNPRAGPCL